MTWVNVSLNVLFFFSIECESNKYGPNCSSTCGHCKDGEPCSTVTGACNGGCEYGWVGKQCDTGKQCMNKNNTELYKNNTMPNTSNYN